ncbi:16S rRNA (adenine(1518)-N(6)/adenine(1519)-N(6))-dimethyltransferase RsmA [Bartonella machadoae]|uniref:16S rRNA (adenine(1518)-N(6)/adenine(1519)-N(6))- dimethyltransferase RsmA n=1 Tax=Bartonella machadoae TaxID=2893471 RepID=UPI001F4D1458|nr:16S rRNA (adenine(1518)-N(6)/adenine(1519)-N(6))-dimethyltransferase RsmA [Bartonella machadoae]UNE53490.1 16S rRNA (adenine(1518)-N(6)/adenine(1519)-N(6))-dimethyltransferase RsmA [Bartonella machadoae]
MPIDNLPPLREVINMYGLQAHKSLGQNFLFDLNLTSKIAHQAGNLEGKPVIEVGPGPGGLTRALLAKGAMVTAIERDERCIPALLEIEKYYPQKLKIIYNDALKQDFSKIFEKSLEKPRIIANLPYNIGTQLLLNWLLAEPWPPFYESMTLMFQREVAKRITAKPQSAHYGRLSVLTGWRTIAKIAFDIPPQAFIPPPKITSSVVHIIPQTEPLPCSAQNLSFITKIAFGQRRKMLRQNLKAVGGEMLLEKAGIDGTRRAETLSISEFVTLANLLI